jgi:hypothetical protein
MIKLKKEKRTLEERGLKDSCFECVFLDDSKISEEDYNWHDMSEEKEVKFGDITKKVRVCKYPIKKITMNHKNLKTTITVPKDCQVYQSIVAEMTFLPNGQKENRILGRLVGIVKDDKVIEERFLGSDFNEVMGVRL